MATVTKKELVDRIADATGETHTGVKQTVQAFLDTIVVELGRGNRIEFRDFGVFEVRHRRRRIAQNPRTLEKVKVPPRRTVKFKPGQLMLRTVDSTRQPKTP
ncbi:MAG: transcriptional regulator [Phycisphaeraceae bacterium]|nr:transcriptional regulator [Phycisphaeraceae bacterium]